MAEDFLLKIRGGYNQFTEAEKRVVDYILSNPKEVLFMSITGLAETCGVGDANVFRFCKTMSYKSYQGFKMLLSLSLHEGKQGFGQMESDINLESSFSQVTKKVLSSDIKAPKETHSLPKEDMFRRVVERFHKAGRICFYGVGTSIAITTKAADKLLKAEPRVYCSPDSHVQTMMASTMSRGKVAVILSYSGATKNTIHVAQLVRQAGAAIVYVTRFVKSPLTAYADLTFLCRASESPLRAGSSSAEVNQFFLIDMLYTKYYKTYYGKCNVNNKKTSASVIAKLCWEGERTKPARTCFNFSIEVPGCLL